VVVDDYCLWWLLLFTEQSLEWESFEQYCVWQLMGAEGPDPSLVIPSLASMSNKGRDKSCLCSSFCLVAMATEVEPFSG